MGEHTSRVLRETATVWRGGGRRYFTRKAAELAQARSAVRSRCDCSNGDYVTPPYSCHYHSMDPGRYHRMLRLYVAMFVRPQMREGST